MVSGEGSTDPRAFSGTQFLRKAANRAVPYLRPSSEAGAGGWAEPESS